MPKCDPRCEAYGTIDEAISVLGVARNLARQARTRELIRKTQEELFRVNAELAAASEDYQRFSARFEPVTAAMADELEKAITGLESGMEMPRVFVIPGTNLASASVDVARTVVRRAERRVVELHQAGLVKNEAVLQYLNRLADLLFTLARYEET